MGETGPHNTTSPRHPNSLNKKQKNVLKRPYLSPTTVFPAAAECMSVKGGPLGLASVPPDIKLVFNTAIAHHSAKATKSVLAL